MAARQIIVPGAMPSRDRNGRVLPAKLRFYVQDTAFNTPAVIYSDSDLVVPHDFPILSDSAGRWPAMWADLADVFDVAWSDQVSDRPLGQWTDLSPSDEAVLASVALAEAAQEQAEECAADAAASALLAEAAAATTSGVPFRATSSTELTVQTGPALLTLDQPGALFGGGQYVVIARPAPNAGTQMLALVQSLTDQVLSVDVGSISGSGTHEDWTVSLTSTGGVQSLGGASGILTAQQARAAIDAPSVAEARSLALIFGLTF